MTVTIVTTIEESPNEKGEMKTVVKSMVQTTEEITEDELDYASRSLNAIFELKDKMVQERQMKDTVYKLHVVNHGAEEETEKIMESMKKLTEEFEE